MVDETASGLVDAIVMPSARSSEHLFRALDIAQRSARLLIILCSRDCKPADVRRRIESFRQSKLPVLIIDADAYQPPWSHWPLGFRLDPSLLWSRDTAFKRNVGLTLARALGLKHVLFLDDDVYGLTHGQASQAVALIESGLYGAAGWSFIDFPDNSVASHAYRDFVAQRYGRQTCFIGGGGLMVGLDDEVPHFPMGVYNEDWLFLFDILSSRRVAHMGHLRQDEYQPYARSANPMAQELGDLIGECLMTVLADRRSWSSQEIHAQLRMPGFWERPLRERVTFLEQVSHSIQVFSDDDEATEAAEAVEAARQSHHRIRALDLDMWASDWRRDADWWCLIWRELKALRPEEDGITWQAHSFHQSLTRALKATRLDQATDLVWSALSPLRV